MSEKWICGKCAREVAQGVDDGQIPEHHRTCPKRAQAVFEKAQAPTNDEREALSNFLFSVYEHGSQPNALREADAILSFLASIRPAQTEPTDEERHWSDAAASAYPGDEYDNADLRTAFGRGVKWERRRPAQTEPEPKYEYQTKRGSDSRYPDPR